LRTFADAAEQTITRALPALRDVARRRPSRTLTIERIGSEPAIRSALTQALRDAGFQLDYRFLRLRIE
jgi:hypothetical protein